MKTPVSDAVLDSNAEPEEAEPFASSGDHAEVPSGLGSCCQASRLDWKPPSATRFWADARAPDASARIDTARKTDAGDRMQLGRGLEHDRDALSPADARAGEAVADAAPPHLLEQRQRQAR